jgi:hypothetical protein
MRSTLITIFTVALLAAGAGSAAARPDMSSNRIDAANHAASMRALARHDQVEAVASPPAPAPIVRVAPVTDGGFNWIDAGIGAGLAAALMLVAAGVSAGRRHSTMTVRS